MPKRDATAAVIGAGDYIGAEIARKFAAEGFTVFAGRRDGAKLEPLVREIEAAGGSIVARALDARKEEEVTAFLNDADKHAPLEVCIFNVGANVNFPILETTDRVFRKVWEMACWAGFVTGRESSRLMVPPAIASAQAASTASSPSLVTALRMPTIWRSPSAWPPRRRRTRSIAGGSGQSLNGAPLRNAPGFLTSTGT